MRRVVPAKVACYTSGRGGGEVGFEMEGRAQAAQSFQCLRAYGSLALREGIESIIELRNSIHWLVYIHRHP